MQQSFYLLSLVFLIGCGGNQPSVSMQTPIPKKEPVVVAIQENKDYLAQNIVPQISYNIEKIEDVIYDKNETKLEDALVQPAKKSKLKKEIKPRDMPVQPIKKPKVKKETKPTKKPKVKKETKPKNARAKPAKKPDAKKVISSSSVKITIGSVEPIRIIPGDKVVMARIDTGAKTSSLNAVEMQIFERDGREFVRFALSKETDALIIEKPIFKWVRIKRHGKKSQRRPIVKLRLVLGNNSQVVAITLTDRGKFKYPLLIGRNFLRDIYIVDVAKKNTCIPKVYEK